MPRPTVHDIAKDAGVSLATVDRVLNKRPGVRAGTIARVHDAIDRLGYVRDMAAANLARQKDYEFVFVVPDGPSSFLRKLNEVIEEARGRARIDRMTISTLRVPPNDPHALVQALEGLDVEQVDGIAIMAPETPQVRDAIRHLKENDISVVAIVSDLPSSEIDQFVGINNVAAGRTAGHLLGGFLGPQPSEVLVLAGSMQARDHAERRLGFDQIMAEKYPHLRVLPTIEAWDDTELVEQLVPAALARHPETVGIYSLGAGNAGLYNVLQQIGGDRLTVVAHELTEVSRKALLDDSFDVIIAQDVGHVVRSAIRMMKANRDMHEVIPSQEKIRIEVIVKENLM
ncbi:MAG: LacI family DNA-binding transcriptional regulator [Pseudomonadota bacterium]